MRLPVSPAASVTLALSGAIIGYVGIHMKTPGGMADPAPIVTFTLCHTGGGTDCVVDGDTIWLAGETIRIADIDAPETHPARCAVEADLGGRATRRLQALLNVGAVTLSGDRADRYGRRLAVISRGGRSLGAMLVDERLARPWTGRRRPWCGDQP